MHPFQMLSIFASIIFFVLVIDFVRRGLLKERYAVLWLALNIAVIVLAIWKGLLDRIAIFLGISYPPSLLFLVAFMFVLLILLHFSIVISSLTERTKELTQELALLKEEGERKEGQGYVDD